MSIHILNDGKVEVVPTTDNSLLYEMPYDLPENCSCKATLSVVARNRNTGDTFSIEKKFAAKRILGDASIVGQPINSMDSQSDSSMENCLVAVGSSGTSLIVYVTGISGETIDWIISLQIMVAQEDGQQVKPIRVMP